MPIVNYWWQLYAVWTVFSISAAYTVIWRSLSVKDCVLRWARTIIIIIIIIITFLVMCHLNKEDNGCITISVQLQKNIENDVISTRIWKDKHLLSTPNQITSLPSTGHVSRSFYRCQVAETWTRLAINVSHWNAYDRSSTSDRTRMSPTRILSLTIVFLLGMQWGGKSGRTVSPGRPPLFPRRYALLTFQMLQFSFSSRSLPLRFRTTPLLSSVPNTAHQAVATGCENDVVVIQFTAQLADKLKRRGRVEVLMKDQYFCIIKSWASMG